MAMGPTATKNPDEQTLNATLKMLVDRALIAWEAKKEGLAKKPEIKTALKWLPINYLYKKYIENQNYHMI